MSERKKITKKKNQAKSLCLILLGIVLIALLLILLLIRIFPKRDYYTIESRVDKVNQTVVIEEEGYETVGWVRIQGTDIDLPIVYNDDIYADYSVAQTGYTWLDNLKPNFSNNILVNGHNIFNLSAQPLLKSDDFLRFEELMSFVYYDFAKENKYVQLTLDGNDYLYKIFMVGFIPTSEKVFFPVGDNLSSEEMDNFLSQLNKLSIYDYDIDVNNNDDILSLVTCTRFYGLDDATEFYVVGRRVRGGEKIQDYRVTKNHNYKEIENILKGDDEDEEI